MNLFDVNDLDHGNYVYKYRVFRMTKMFAVLMSYELLTVFTLRSCRIKLVQGSS